MFRGDFLAVIDGSGKVEFREAHCRFVAPPTDIARERAVELLTLVYRGGFFRLKGDYGSRVNRSYDRIELAGGRKRRVGVSHSFRVTDLPDLFITARANGRTRRALYVTANPVAPMVLVELLELIVTTLQEVQPHCGGVPRMRR